MIQWKFVVPFWFAFPSHPFPLLLTITSALVLGSPLRAHISLGELTNSPTASGMAGPRRDSTEHAVSLPKVVGWE